MGTNSVFGVGTREPMWYQPIKMITFGITFSTVIGVPNLFRCAIKSQIIKLIIRLVITRIHNDR